MVLWVELCPSPKYVEVLIPCTSECDLGIGVVADVVKVKSKWNKWVFKPI